jgi:hypothetical protein
VIVDCSYPIIDHGLNPMWSGMRCDTTGDGTNCTGRAALADSCFILSCVRLLTGSSKSCRSISANSIRMIRRRVTSKGGHLATCRLRSCILMSARSSGIRIELFTLNLSPCHRSRAAHASTAAACCRHVSFCRCTRCGIPGALLLDLARLRARPRVTAFRADSRLAFIPFVASSAGEVRTQPVHDGQAVIHVGSKLSLRRAYAPLASSLTGRAVGQIDSRISNSAVGQLSGVTRRCGPLGWCRLRSGRAAWSCNLLSFPLATRRLACWIRFAASTGGGSTILLTEPCAHEPVATPS